MIRWIAIICVTVSITAHSRCQMVVLPAHARLSLPEGNYAVTLCNGKCRGLKMEDGVLVLAEVDGSSRCAVNGDGEIQVASDISAAAQRKVLIHEVVHIAISCDMRDELPTERIAEDEAALYDDLNFREFMKP